MGLGRDRGVRVECQSQTSMRGVPCKGCQYSVGCQPERGMESNHTRETQHIAFKTKHGAGGASLLGGGGGHSGNLSLAAYKEIDQII